MTTAVILAGGKGTRISEETRYIPKPMIMLDDRPIIHHIMDEFISWGVRDFIILTGYKQEVIFGYFFGCAEDVYRQGTYVVCTSKEWTVRLVPSGLESQTGGRLLHIKDLVDDDFYFTYGDGLSNIDLDQVMHRHKISGAIATISGVHPAPRFGSLHLNSVGKVIEFGEKVDHLDGWINGGFAVLSPAILEYIRSPQCNLEKEVYPQLAHNGYLYAVTHDGFWQCVDTLRDLDTLNTIYKEQGKIWLKS